MQSGARMARVASENGDEFRAAFVSRVHELLEIGYRRMKPETFSLLEEPDISGELATKP